MFTFKPKLRTKPAIAGVSLLLLSAIAGIFYFNSAKAAPE